MDSKAQIEAMARKYKEEMLRMYKQSGKTSSGASQTASPPKNIQPARPAPPKPAPIVQPMKPTAAADVLPTKNVFTQEIPHTEKPAHTFQDSRTESKFPSPEEIMREEFGETLESRFNRVIEPQNESSYAVQDEISGKNSRDEAFPRVNDTAAENFQGNYNSKEFSDISDPLEPRYNETDEENSSPDESGTGYIKAEVTTGGGAVPIENAVVLITKKENGKTYLLKMLISDDSGSTETVALPAPNVAFSETPDPSEKPFADYYISTYADGFYAENDMEVPVFSGVKSIQPVALIPKSSDDSRFMLN